MLLLVHDPPLHLPLLNRIALRLQLRQLPRHVLVLFLQFRNLMHHVVNPKTGVGERLRYLLLHVALALLLHEGFAHAKGNPTLVQRAVCIQRHIELIPDAQLLVNNADMTQTALNPRNIPAADPAPGNSQ